MGYAAAGAAIITKPPLILYEAAPRVARRSAAQPTNRVNAQINSIHPAEL